jgi:hypothetical protein
MNWMPSFSFSYYTCSESNNKLIWFSEKKNTEAVLEFDRQGSFQEFALNVGWDTRDKILKKHVAANCELVPIDLNLQLIFSENWFERRDNFRCSIDIGGTCELCLHQDRWVML